MYIDDNILYPPFTAEKCKAFAEYADSVNKRIEQHEGNRYALAYNEIMGEKEVEIIVIDYDEEGNPIGEHTETITIPYPVVNPNYEEEQYIKHRQELDALTLTPADVERALYKAKGMDFEDLKALISQQLPMVDIKGLSIEFRAKDFYRGAEAAGMRLFDAVGQLLGYTPDDMDYLFEHKELPNERI